MSAQCPARVREHTSTTASRRPVRGIRNDTSRFEHSPRVSQSPAERSPFDAVAPRAGSSGDPVFADWRLRPVMDKERCPRTGLELQAAVVRFLCEGKVAPGSPLASITADLRREYMRAGHSKLATEVFKASAIGDSLRSIHWDLRASGFSSVLELDDRERVEDLRVVCVDSGRIGRVLMLPPPSRNHGMHLGAKKDARVKGEERDAKRQKFWSESPDVTLRCKATRKVSTDMSDEARGLRLNADRRPGTFHEEAPAKVVAPRGSSWNRSASLSGSSRSSSLARHRQPKRVVAPGYRFGGNGRSRNGVVALHDETLRRAHELLNNSKPCPARQRAGRCSKSRSKSSGSGSNGCCSGSGSSSGSSSRSRLPGAARPVESPLAHRCSGSMQVSHKRARPRANEWSAERSESMSRGQQRGDRWDHRADQRSYLRNDQQRNDHPNDHGSEHQGDGRRAHQTHGDRRHRDAQGSFAYSPPPGLGCMNDFGGGRDGRPVPRGDTLPPPGNFMPQHAPPPPGSLPMWPHGFVHRYPPVHGPPQMHPPHSMHSYPPPMHTGGLLPPPGYHGHGPYHHYPGPPHHMFHAPRPCGSMPAPLSPRMSPSRSRRRVGFRIMRVGRGRKGARRGRGRRARVGGSDASAKAKAKCEDVGSKRAAEERPEKLFGDSWEEPREKNGLKFLSDSSPDSSSWAFALRDESRRSYAGHRPGALSAQHCKDLFCLIHDSMNWKQPESRAGAIPRKTGWMVSRGCSCTYRYGGLEVDPEEFPTWMNDLMALTMPQFGLADPGKWPNSCNLNLYTDGGMSVGWHADDEQLFQGKSQDCRILSLSLGARRKFELRMNWPELGERASHRIILGDGDLLTMEGMTQKHFTHRIPKEPKVDTPRINLTWRWVVRHSPRCAASRSNEPS